MKLSKLKIKKKGLYWGLILTFFVIYICVGFVSTLHAITFFQMANTMGLAILLALAFEVGQSSVLFSILMADKDDKRWLPWILMILLTALQVTGNVFASFKHIMTSGNLDWQYFQKSILFGIEAPNPEMYQVIISWLQGALLPVVALGLTALVAQNINLIVPREEESKEDDEFGPVDLTNEKPDDIDIGGFYDEIDESGIGGEPTKEEEEKISDFINHDTRINIDENKLKEEFQKYDDPDIRRAFDAKFEEIKPQIEYSLDPRPTEIPEPEDVYNYYKEKYAEKNEKDVLDEEAENLTANISDENITDLPTASLGIDIQAEFDKELSKQFEKDFIIPENKPKKTRGRPPKQKEVEVAASKKEQGPLQKEENVSVPQKEQKNKTIDPLKTKSTTETVTDLNQVIKPSKGEEVIKLLESIKKPEVVESIIEPLKTEEMVQESTLTPPEYKSYVDEKGVEVIDAKAIEKNPLEVKKK